MGLDYKKLTTDPEYRARVREDFKAKEAARVAAMSPEERAEYERRTRDAEEYESYLAEPVTVTRGELQMQEDYHDLALEWAEERGIDSVLPSLKQATQERDAAQADAERTHKNLTGALNALGHASVKAASATSSQGGTDRKLTEANKRIAELEAEVAQLTKERDAARAALLGIDPEEAHS